MVYHAVRTFADAMSAIPLSMALLFGRGVGWMVRAVDRRHRRVALQNLDRSYGDSLSPQEKEGIVRAVYGHLGIMLVELIRGPRIIRRGRWRERIRIVGEENAHAAAALGKGVIFVSGHLGNWELLGVGMTLLGFPLHTVYRPLDNPLLDRYLRRERTRFGQKIIPRDGSTLSLMRVLRRGGFLGVLVDQNQKVGGIFVDFFGRKASTVRGVATLHRRTGAPIVTGYIRREPGLFRHRILVDRPIWCERTDDPEEDVRRVTQEFTSRLEGYIRDVPGQWLWLHRRWRTRPPGEDGG
jgi:KDO2-lipid IV(A) lauroyltransferase